MSVAVSSILLHGYIALRLLPAMASDQRFVVPTAALLVISAGLIPLGFWLRRAGTQPPAPTRRVLTWAALLALGLFSSLFVLTILRDAALLAGALAALAAPEASAPLSAFAYGSAHAVPVIALAMSSFGYANARRTARLRTVDIPVEGLPAPLHGFTIAQISDLHVGPTIRRRYVEAVVRAVNRTDADMVAVTGDLVDGSVADLAEHAAPLAGLTSREGTFFVTGNHEYYSGARGWTAELSRMGIRVLANEHVVLRRGSASLVLAGVTDYGAGGFDPTQRSDPQAALRGAPSDAALRVLLAHQPRSAAAAERAGFDLQLSGHTHGGQFLPWRWFVRLQQPFTAGLHRVRGLRVYVSRGTGYWGPPKRFGAPSEITLLRLVAAPQLH